ncbi:hypothetical protein COU18_01565 [Candidatus Kaiserbacteria bacterium CG10_big_fil_rev_8_21_14_0_10_51_14]|uniref:Uncharacterized protein n=1 Tax=Candidatus Kaiserbacteria bacterium CG10_big_fil_rev_8_21_14_0_10_51_14 TaxID=1974610 RepID=A0A2H0UCB6_9BACT|nr:MAG: hypothetical protein COU18_01565 [Candidatus Kaiserbacteria bacterium CG10_big_fil_rev_8_21_14_0_10_51_14]
MAKARNGVRHDAMVKSRAIALRNSGWTHREITKELGVSLSTAWLWVRGVQVSPELKSEIEKRRNVRRWDETERRILGQRLRPFQFKIKYGDEDLLNKIRLFYEENGRIPLKKEFNALRIYRERFGSWNSAIQKAGFETNPVLFARRYVARDGHVCDSFTERIIDDWLTENNIAHRRNVRYGLDKSNVDFLINDTIAVEFFGLAGVQIKYDRIIVKKRRLAKKLGWQLIEIYAEHMYPKNKLPLLLRSITKN